MVLNNFFIVTVEIPILTIHLDTYTRKSVSNSKISLKIREKDKKNPLTDPLMGPKDMLWRKTLKSKTSWDCPVRYCKQSSQIWRKNLPGDDFKPLVWMVEKRERETGRPGHSLFFSRFALRSFFIHGSLSLILPIFRFAHRSIALKNQWFALGKER